MKKKEAPSKLQAAVEAVETELLNLDRLAEQALRHPLNSEKHMQSTASSLQGIAEMEQKLRAAMALLGDALGEIGARQELRMKEISARAAELKARHDMFLSLMERYRALGASAGDLQTTLGGITDDAAMSAAIPGIIETVGSLVAEAESVEAAATKDDFIDVVRHTTSLRQQLSSLHTNLLRKAGN